MTPPCSHASNLLQFPSRGQVAPAQPIKKTDKFRPFNDFEQEMILRRFYDIGASIRSIARFVKCAESRVEEVLRENHRKGMGRSLVINRVLRRAA